MNWQWKQLVHYYHDSSDMTVAATVKLTVMPTADLKSLPPIQTAPRLQSARDAMAKHDCEALLVTNMTNIRWLCGFSGSAGLLVLNHDNSVLLTDGRYEVQAPTEVEASGAGVEVRIVSRGASMLKELIAPNTRLGLEEEHVSWQRQRSLAEDFQNLVPVKSLVEQLRRYKDESEIARMQVAAGITDAALAEVLPLLKDGVSEQIFATELDREMRLKGASEPAFETIVATGLNSALPHARPGPDIIQPDEIALIDVGSVFDGYRSDMTRTYVAGAASETVARMWEVVSQAQQLGVEAVTAGVTAGSIDQACREFIADAGWGEAFVHSTGHGVGLDIHEVPGVSATSEEIIKAGEVITVEPGVYFPEQGGVRIEDTVLVTEQGCVPLTQTPKLMCL